MGEPGNRIVKRTHSLFVGDLKVYQESHNVLKNVNEIIVQASHSTGACYGVLKCAEIIFERGKMVIGEGPQVLEERMKTMEFEMNIEQADSIQTKTVSERVKEEVLKRAKMIANTDLNDANLIKGINVKFILVAAYALNLCRFNVGELKELDQTIKRELREKNMLGKQASNERMYLRREKDRRGLKTLRDM